MKKLLLITGFILIGLSGFAQKRTSDKVWSEIQKQINNNVVFVTPEIHSLFAEYNVLLIKEISKAETQKLAITPMLQEKACFVCICTNGHVITSSECRSMPGTCGTCSWCGATSQSYVMSCIGGMCGSIQGFMQKKDQLLNNINGAN